MLSTNTGNKLMRQNLHDWRSGFDAGAAQQNGTAPAGVDALAWQSGYIEGQASTKRGRGRPRKPDALSDAERSRRYRQRKRDQIQQAADNPELGMRWWNSLGAIDRAYWLGAADSARPADAFAAYVRKHGLPDA